MPGETTLGPENRPVTMQNWLAGTIVGTMVTIVLMMFVPGWLVFTDESTNLRVYVSIYYWYVCREGNITCGAYGVGQPDAYRYIKDTNATPENTVMLVSVDMIVCILCALVVLGDMAGKQPRTTWWNNLKLGILIFIIFVLNLTVWPQQYKSCRKPRPGCVGALFLIDPFPSGAGDAPRVLLPDLPPPPFHSRLPQPPQYLNRG